MMKRRSLAAALLALTLGALPDCSRPAPGPGVRARFGIFFGGDLQEREALPLILDRSRQSHGIRLEFDDVPSEPLRVEWEIEKPGSGKDGGGGLVDYGDVKTRPGARTLDVPLAFRATDRPGPWRVRVRLEGRPLLDRAFRVVPAGATPAPLEE